jgi:hypothetical protein
MNRWMRLLRDIFLRQLLRRDGCADSNLDLCPRCGDVSKQAHYRCEDCAGGLLLCKNCCLDRHAKDPLHVVYVSNLLGCRAREH